MAFFVFVPRKYKKEAKEIVIEELQKILANNAFIKFRDITILEL